METIFDKAKHYYKDYTPPLWGLDRLQKLVESGKLTAEQVTEITGED